MITCAQTIRKELKDKFPNIKFSVRTRRNAIDIEYSNSIPENKIKEVVSKYEMGHFDGMDDSYKYTNTRDDIPQVNYVFIRRNISDDIYKKVEDQIATEYGLQNQNDDNEWFNKFGFWKNQVVNRKISEIEL